MTLAFVNALFSLQRIKDDQAIHEPKGHPQQTLDINLEDHLPPLRLLNQYDTSAGRNRDDV